MKRVLPFILSAVFLVLISCNSVPKNIPEDMQPEEYFKNAQSAVVDWGNYKRALFYYNAFIEKYPDMKGKILEAEYEIALIYYKKENYYESEKDSEAYLTVMKLMMQFIIQNGRKFFLKRYLSRLKRKRNTDYLQINIMQNR